MNPHAATLDAVRRVVDEVLHPCGFRLVDDHYDEASFGSRVCDWRRGVELVRAVWDGKEGWLDVVRVADSSNGPPWSVDDVWLLRSPWGETGDDLRRRIDERLPELREALTRAVAG